MERSKTRNHVLKLCVAALMAALVALSTKLYIPIPSIVGQSRFHLGNAFCALSGILLGPWWGGLASGIGSMIFDLTDPAYIAEAPITFVTKGMYGVMAGLVFYKAFKGKNHYAALLTASFCAALTYIVLYLGKTYFYNALFLKGLTPAAAWIAVVEKIPSSLFNGAVAVIFAPILSMAIMRALKSAHLDQKVLYQKQA